MKCINAKTYALTVGNEYDVVAEEGNYIFVHNDKNLLRKYHRNLFEAPAPELPMYTSYAVGANTLTFENTDFRFAVPEFRSEELDCCGIREAIGFHAFLRDINNLTIPENTFANQDEVPLDEIKSDLIHYRVMQAIEGMSLIISTVSTIIRDTLMDNYIAYIQRSDDGFVINHHNGTNNNSGNMLNVYLISEP